MTTILQEAAAGRATLVPWTVDQYHRAIEAGLLPADTSVELLEGFIVRKDRARSGDDSRTIGDRHRIALLRLAQDAQSFVPHGCFLQTQQPVSLPPSSEPEPDAAVVRGHIDDYMDAPPSAGDVTSLIEVADSSRTLDLGPKLRAYARAGVPQYIVVDLVADSVVVHDTPAGEAYEAVTTLRRGDTVRISTPGGAVPVSVDRLLP